jgi:hypothetical protein
VLQVTTSLILDNVIVSPSLHNVKVAVNVLLQLVILNALDVFVCGVQYVNVKLANVNILPLCVALVTALVLATQLVPLS